MEAKKVILGIFKGLLHSLIIPYILLYLFGKIIGLWAFAVAASYTLILWFVYNIYYYESMSKKIARNTFNIVVAIFLIAAIMILS